MEKETLRWHSESFSLLCASSSFMCSIQQILKHTLVIDVQHQSGMNVLPVKLAIWPFFFLLLTKQDMARLEVRVMGYTDMSYFFYFVTINDKEMLSARGRNLSRELLYIWCDPNCRDRTGSDHFCFQPCARKSKI